MTNELINKAKSALSQWEKFAHFEKTQLKNTVGAKGNFYFTLSLVPKIKDVVQVEIDDVLQGVIVFNTEYERAKMLLENLTDDEVKFLESTY